MSTIAFIMPNEGHLGGFDIRRFVKKYMSIGLAISIGVHSLAIGTYYFVLYMQSREIPPPTQVVYIDPSNLGPPPSISNEDIAPALKIALPKLPSVALIPKPVVQEVAEDKPQIATQQEIAAALDANVDSLLAGFGQGDNIEIKQTIPEDVDVSQAPAFVPFEQAPQIVKRVEPVYPEIATMAEVNGSVVVQFYVDKKGNVGKILIMTADPPKMGFEEAAMAAIAQWKFTPALQRDNPVGVWMSNKFTFKIK